MHCIDNLTDLYLTMDGSSAHSPDDVEDTHPASDMARSYGQNTPPPASSNVRRSVERSFSNASQTRPQLQHNGVGHDSPSNQLNPGLFRHSSLPPENTAVNDELTLRNGEAAATSFLSQVNNAEQGAPQVHGRSQNQLQIRLPLDFTPTETSFAEALGGQATDPDERPDPISQPDMSFKFDAPHTKSAVMTNKAGIPLAEIAARFARGRANEYEYTRLELSNEVQIRRLRIEPGLDDAPIICSLIPSSLDEPYEALSYVWGTDEPTEEIKIREPKQSAIPSKSRFPKIQERSFYVRPNLYAALRNFRSRKNYVDLWIDALCIDQENDEEKEIQIAMMEGIYSKATRVLIWLGEPKPFSPEAFECIRKMCDLSLFDGLLNVESSSLLHALGQLMNDVWFSRRWVVQELAMAKQASLHCGTYKIHWVDFADAIAFYVMSYDRIKSLPQADLPPDRPKPPPEVKRLGPSVLVDATSNLFRRSNDDNIIEHRQTLEALVSSLTAYEASDPRDTIYAVLSLAKDTYRGHDGQSPAELQQCQKDRTMGHGLRPEYEKDVFEVCKDFIQSCTHRPESPSLDIICRHWAPLCQEFKRLEQADVLKKIKLHDKNWLYERKLASWIPSIKGASFGSPKDAFQGRVNGDSLVGIPPNRPNYNATPGCVLKVEFPMIPEDVSIRARRNRAKMETSPVQQRMVSDGTMSVRGVRLDTIDELSQRCDEGKIFVECLEIGGWKADKPAEVPDPLWRTMVADRGPNGIPAPSWYKRACRHAIARRNPNNDVRTGSLISEGKDSLGVEFLKRVRDVIWNRKFFCTEDEERLGLAPQTAKRGDIVCVFYGCSVPVLIRKIKNKDKSKEEYEFIGECYLHGMMDGEAVSGARKAELKDKEEDFILR
jgi:hypothetical protein